MSSRHMIFHDLDQGSSKNLNQLIEKKWIASLASAILSFLHRPLNFRLSEVLIMFHSICILLSE